MDDVLKPSARLLIKLGSALIHAEEFLSPHGNWRSILKQKDTWTPTHLPMSAYYYPGALSAFQSLDKEKSE